MKSDHETVSRPNSPLRASPVVVVHHRRRLGLRPGTRTARAASASAWTSSGGTILVYEVDAVQDDRAGPAELQRPEDLAASLKRRIDPADLYNVTIRPVPGDPPRVEIILPTGGPPAGQRRGRGLGQACSTRSRQGVPPAGATPTTTCRPGRSTSSINRVIDSKPEEGRQARRLRPAIANIIHNLAPEGSNSALVHRRGNREHQEPDPAAGPAGVPHPRQRRGRPDAIDGGHGLRRTIQNNAETLKRPRPSGSRRRRRPGTATAISPSTSAARTVRHQYSWVEVGKEELYSLAAQQRRGEHAGRRPAKGREPR